MTTINTEGISKAELLAALFNHSRPQGLGLLLYKPDDMTTEEAQRDLDSHKLEHGVYIDYLHGRVLKVDFSTDEPRTDLYNRDNGHNAFENIVQALRDSSRT